jgi:hypothetical protein
VAELLLCRLLLLLERRVAMMYAMMYAMMRAMVLMVPASSSSQYIFHRSASLNTQCMMHGRACLLPINVSLCLGLMVILVGARQQQQQHALWFCRRAGALRGSRSPACASPPS